MFLRFAVRAPRSWNLPDPYPRLAREPSEWGPVRDPVPSRCDEGRDNLYEHARRTYAAACRLPLLSLAVCLFSLRLAPSPVVGIRLSPILFIDGRGEGPREGGALRFPLEQDDIRGDKIRFTFSERARANEFWNPPVLHPLQTTALRARGPQT